MPELDIEVLKRLDKEWNPLNGKRLYVMVPAIIAALEDRDRLRAALIAYGDHIQPLCPALSGGLCDCGWTLEAAALIPEGRND